MAFILGRLWCGWICPLGTLLGWLRFDGPAAIVDEPADPDVQGGGSPFIG